MPGCRLDRNERARIAADSVPPLSRGDMSRDDIRRVVESREHLAILRSHLTAAGLDDAVGRFKARSGPSSHDWSSQAHRRTQAAIPRGYSRGFVQIM